MILYHWRGSARNFGDELNTLLWPALLPGFFDGDPSVRFLGIGSVLDRRHPGAMLKLVAGTGYGGYQAKPTLDRSWIIHWVRGPHTARALGLSPRLALGDPAALMPAVWNLSAGCGQDIGFMPHFESAARGGWHHAAAAAGLRLIDPRDTPLDILQAMAGCKLILSEALHGIIVADALRIPWVPLRPIARIHRRKWFDWSAMMELSTRFMILPPSTWAEWAGAGAVANLRVARAWLRRREAVPAQALPARALDRAADALRRAALADPQLSASFVLDRTQSAMLEAIRMIARAPYNGATVTAAARPIRPSLQQDPDSAYELSVTG